MQARSSRRSSRLCGRFAADDGTGNLCDAHQKNEAKKDDSHAEHNDQSSSTNGDFLHGGVNQKHVSSSSQGAEAP